MTHLLIDVKNRHMFTRYRSRMGDEQVLYLAQVNEGGADRGTAVARLAAVAISHAILSESLVATDLQ